MVWVDVQGQWKRVAPKIRRHWFRLSDADVKSIEGRRDVFVDRLCMRYGFTSDEAEREIEAWLWLVQSSDLVQTSDAA